MASVVAIEHLTLDGVMQSPGSPEEDSRDGFRHGGWAAERQDPAMQEAIGRRMSTSWSLLAGRTTYRQFADFWPKQHGNPFSNALTQAQKYVASTTLTEPLPWRNSALLKGDAPTAVADLKSHLDKTLVIFGSGVLVQTLLKHSLIDELVLMVHPITLGTGRRLFADTAPTAYRLTESTTTRTGVAIAVYGRAETEA